MIDLATIKQAARGRWREILSSLGNVSLGVLDGKHHPCPKCGGKDRFRLIDAEAGALFCNQCLKQGNGDGIAALMWLRGCDFDVALAELAKHLGIAPATEREPCAAAREQPWPDIESLDSVDLPAFPTRALPGPLQRWVEAESHATQTPADLAGLLALAVCSAAIARRVEVQPRPGWREPVNLYVAVLLEPANRKSAVFADATGPLRELEAELIEEARPRVAREQSERRRIGERLKKLEKQDKNASQVRQEAGDLAEQLAEQPEPVLPRLIVDDATSEKLGIMLAEQSGRIASMSAEGGVFDLMAGLYAKNGIPQFVVYLKSHSGDDLITDRVSRKAVRVERPALTCAYAIQPIVISALAEQPAFRGRGLLARFLYAAPQSWVGRREIAPAPVSNSVKEAYRQTVRALAAADEDYTLHLDAEASAALHAWESEIETMLDDGGQLELMRDWGGKLAGATLRLAAVLHCVEHGAAGSIDGTTFRAAVEIARYLVPHAEAVLCTMLRAATEDGDARYLLRWIERRGLREFNKRQAYQHGRRRFDTADDLDPVLAELVRRGYIRLRPSERAGPGRPNSPSYEVNPAFSIAEERSQYPQNSSARHENRDIGDIEYSSARMENANGPAAASEAGDYGDPDNSVDEGVLI